MPKLPTILATHELDFGGRFHVEQLDLEFSNGARRKYERMKSRGRGAVIVPLLPFKSPPANSREIKQFLEGHRGRQPGSLAVMLILRLPA